MRIGRIVATLVSVSIVGSAAYAALLTSQVARLRGGPTPDDIVFSAGVMAGIAFLFAALVLLPLSFFLRKSANARSLVIAGGLVIWFALSFVALSSMGDAADRAVSQSVLALIIGVPMVVAHVAILGRWQHA